MIVAQSAPMRRALLLAERYARTRLPILIVGATGTGKELLAQHIHERSGRPGHFVDVNAWALPRDMVESLVFGHRRGAFTGAVESTIGYVERSDGGTLFLDELAGLEETAQGKLLRVLETGYVEALGAGVKRRVDLRVVCAAQDTMARALAEGRFRQDLFQRLAGVLIELLPLASRSEDVLPLAEHFAAARGRRLERGVEEELVAYGWPGNVRELQMTIERAGELVEDGTLSRSAVAEAIELGQLTRVMLSNGARLDERAQFLKVCEAQGWNTAAIMRVTGLSRTTLHRRLREFGVSLRETKKYHFVSRCAEQCESTGAPTARDG